MCGIVGYWEINNSISTEDKIFNMLEKIKNRGPDSQNIWYEKDSTNPVLGHTRLSIQDLSDAGNQPFLSSNNDWVISFNGEIYNNDALKKKIQSQKKIKWKGHSDTEVIAEFLSIFGINNFRKQANGMYAIAAFNKLTKELFLLRDFFGEKPLYYFFDKNCICFSSNINAIKIYKKDYLKIDNLTASSLVKYGFIPFNETIYKKVLSLTPGEMIKVSYSDEKLKLSKYKKIIYRFENTYKKGEILDEIDEILSQSVKMRLIGDCKVGCLLSGGIDSSLIAYYAQKHLNGVLDTFNIRFNVSGYDESQFAAEVSNFIGSKHNSYLMEEKDILNAALNMKYCYDQPFADQSQLALFFLCEKIRKKENIKVALTGDGGDELFCGYNRYGIGYDLYKKIGSNPVLKQLLKLLKITPFNFIDFLLHSLPRKVRFSSTKSLFYKLLNVIDSETIYEYYEFLISKNNENILKNQKILSKLKKEFLKNINKNISTKDNDSRSKLMQLDRDIYLPNDILVKSDRASMYYGLELRSPFLDPVIYEWCLTKGKDYQYYKKKSKYILRCLLKKNIPNYNFNRPKMGFGIPLDNWLRFILKDWAEEVIFNEKLKDDIIINQDILKKKWKNLLSGEDCGLELWPCLMYCSWRYDI